MRNVGTVCDTRIVAAVRIIEFGPERGRAITRHGSSGLRATNLIGDDAVYVTALHVTAGGEVGRHRAPVDQLFLVVSGSGHVSGGDGSWRAIRAGQAALWRGGEDHTARADEDLTAIVIEMARLPLTADGPAGGEDGPAGRSRRSGGEDGPAGRAGGANGEAGGAGGEGGPADGSV